MFRSSTPKAEYLPICAPDRAAARVIAEIEAKKRGYRPTWDLYYQGQFDGLFVFKLTKPRGEK